MSSLIPTDQPRLSSQDRLLQKIQEKWPQYHPVLAMVQLAHDVDIDGEDGDRALAFACHKEVAKYTVSVDRVSEIKADVRQTKRVIVEMFGASPQPQVLENDPPPKLEATLVQDVAVSEAVMVETGPVEDQEPELVQLFGSRYLENPT